MSQQALINYNLHFAKHLLKAQNELRIISYKNNSPTISGSIQELFWIREIEWLKNDKENFLKNNYLKKCMCVGSDICSFCNPFEHYYPGSHGENMYYDSYYDIVKGENKKLF